MIPKSTCQTSPRSGTLSVLLLVEPLEHFGSERGKVVVREIVRHWNALNDGTAQLDALRRRELLDLGEDVSNSLGHGRSLFAGALRGKRAKSPNV
ncbi:MAG: hypothetical protein M3463_06605 [Verrucomicrobiota bacterium]|nr:hypothetical protein [Verrucomicrobiota bacterium]